MLFTVNLLGGLTRLSKLKTLLPYREAQSLLSHNPARSILLSKETMQFGLPNTINFYISSHSSCLLCPSKYSARKQNPQTAANESKVDLILLIPSHIKSFIYPILLLYYITSHLDSTVPATPARVTLHLLLSPVFSAAG